MTNTQIMNGLPCVVYGVQSYLNECNANEIKALICLTVINTKATANQLKSITFFLFTYELNITHPYCIL